MTWQELSVEQLNRLRNSLVIDVRSPCEHNAESIPGSKNVPLLSNEERSEVGTVYNQQGEIIARRLALRIIAPKIPQILDDILAMRSHSESLVIHCWRGGMRSEAVCSMLSMAGVDCFRLSGGYKAFRAHVIKDLETDAFPFEPVVLVGLTGSGKTDLLQALANQGVPTLDLEALANHRGSVFGGIGLGVQPSQKDFEAKLWMALKNHAGKRVFIEGESRKIGQLALPDCVLNRILKGPFILVHGSLRKRAERIAADYLNSKTDQRQQLEHAVQLMDHLKPRLSSQVIEELKEMLLADNIVEAVERILVDYYDPLYGKQLRTCQNFAVEVNSDEIEPAANKICNWARGLISASC
jgi:tRNA 2-selenouridine synthase